MDNVKVQTVLLSVSDKSGLVQFGRALVDTGAHLLSSGGTHRTLADAHVEVLEVSSYTGSPEMMEGRVKTLHPRIHGGLLGRLDGPGEGPDAAVMKQHGIRAIDMLVVNFYPFEQTVADPAVTLNDAIENIDIGGPAMLRSAAKNFARVVVIVEPADYPLILEEMERQNGAISYATRFRLATKAFVHVAKYDVAIASYLAGVKPPGVASAP